MEDRVRPFSTGDEYICWDGHNCSHCWNSAGQEAKNFRCSLEKNIWLASMGDGQISRKVADRLGANGGNSIAWNCPEKQPRDKPAPPRKKKKKLAPGQLELVLDV